ncbi:MAG: fatty acid desaturase [Verrucomicrobiales bacterium]|jgi:hypothetical protein|nr:fatty acid desaturase [Verrucomicrobiales bacterium]
MSAIQETIIDALRTFSSAMDNLFPVSCKIAYLILVTALATAVWNGREGSPVQLIWKILACCFIVTAIAVWGDWVKPGSGLFSDVGEGLAESINQKAGFSAYNTNASEAIEKAKSETSALAVFENLRYAAFKMLDWLATALRWLVKTLQYTVILFCYGIGPIFLSLLAIQATSPIGKKFLFMLAGFYLWDLIWRLIEIIAVGILHFGGFTNYALFPLAAVWLILGYILGPIFGTALFTAGHTGISHIAGRMATQAASKASSKTPGQAWNTLKNTAAQSAKLVTGPVGAAAAVASAGGKLLGKLTGIGKSAAPTGANVAADNGTGTTAKGTTTASSGPVSVGETAQAGVAQIKRTSPDTFSMNGSEHNGNPNNATDLNRALNATTYSAADKSAIRMSMAQRNTPARNLTQEKNQQVAREFPV